MNKSQYRLIQSGLLLFTLIVLCLSLYLQYGLKLEPCPLCLMQRGCVIILVGLSLIGVIHPKRRSGQVFSILQMVFIICGLFFVSRQLWIQTFPPDQAPSCLPGFDMLIHYFPWQDIIKTIFWGTSDCAENQWHFLGISLPVWSALYFLSMFVLNLLIYRKLRNDSVFSA